MGGFGQRLSNLAGIDIDREQPDVAGMDFSKLSPEMRAHIMQKLQAKRQRAPAPAMFQDPFARGAEQVSRGWKQLWAPSDTTAADPAWWKSKQEAAADVLEGASPFMAPAALIGVAAAPVAGLAELGAGTAAGMGSEYLARKAGVPSGAAKLVGGMASIPGAAMAGTAGLTAEDLVSGARAVGRGVEAGTEAFNRAIAYPESELDPEAGVLQIGKPKAAKPRDVKARTVEDLEQRIPHSVRAVSKDPTRTIDGKSFHDLNLDEPGEGFLPMARFGEKQADNMVKAAWKQAIDESEMEGGSAARQAVEKTGAAPRGAEFWDKAFRQPKRSRYWYELSGESFTGKHFDVPKEIQPLVIDAHAGTSGGVEPGPNSRRAIGILAEDVQKQPVMTDLRDPVSARNALARRAQGLRSLKYRSFGGTMKYTTGLSSERPLTTNDVQVASMFGIKGNDIGQNPVLYEVLSRFFLKMRDMQNQGLIEMHQLPSGTWTAAGGKAVQPWETWQMQAPAWVYERALKNPAKASEYDDYSLVLPRIIQQLARAGVPTPGGKITMETLMDPRTPNLMSGTRERFLATPVATMEVASKLTPEGAAAADLYGQIAQLDPAEPWVRNAKKSYQQIQRNMMSGLMKRKGGNKELGISAEPSLISQLTSAIVGRPVDVSRIDRMGFGTFEGEINPNMRIPLTGRANQKWISLDPVQREAMLAMLGQDTQQEAMAASLFESVPKGAPAHTYSVFLRRYDGVVDQDAITAFSNQLGHSVNVSQVPNGVLIDVNMEFPEGAPQYGPAKEAVHAAAKAAFGGDRKVEDIGYFGRNYDGHYVTKAEYKEKIDVWKRTQRTTPGAAGTGPGGTGRAGDPAQRAGDLARIRQKVRSHARVRDKASAKWTADNRARLQKHLAKAPPAGAEP